MNDLRPEMFDPEFLLEHIRRDTKFDADLLEKIISEWKRYKATGLEPEEISDIIKLCGDYNKAGLDARFVQACIDVAESGLTTDRLRNLLTAEKAGRLVVLSDAEADALKAYRDGRMEIKCQGCWPVDSETAERPKCFYNDNGSPLCLGLAVGDDDYPIEKCQKCWYSEYASVERAEAALRKEQEHD